MIPNLQIGDTGVIAPDRESIQDGLWQMMTDAFGSDLTIDDRTPQGQLVTSLTAIIMDRDNATVELANNFDPRYARGVFQEALGALYFIEPIGATSSVVDLQFMGEPGSIQPYGTEVIDINGNIWITGNDAICNESGIGLATASSEVSGEIRASADSITIITSPATGIDRVTNPSPAIAGRNAESRIDFENRRQQSVAANSKGMVASVYGALVGLPGVVHAYAIDNPTDETVEVGVTGYPMIRNSLLVSVVGGSDEDIARTIITKAGTGCAFVGDVEYTYIDTENFEVYNAPSYEVRFIRPSHIRVYVRVTLSNFGDITFITRDLIRDRIADNDQVRISASIYASRFACLVPAELNVVNIEISRDGEEWDSFLLFGVDEIPVFHTDDVFVVQG